MLLEIDKIRPVWSAEDLPECSDECPSHDGKRCHLLGFEPERICEPAIVILMKRIEVKENNE